MDVEIELVEEEDDQYPEPSPYSVWSAYVRELNEKKVHWRYKGNCVTTEKRVNMFPPREDKQKAVAKAVCAECPQIVDCLFFALVNKETHGVWGGMTEADRSEIFKTLSDDGLDTYREQFTKEHETYLWGLAEALTTRFNDGILLKAQA